MKERVSDGSFHQKNLKIFKKLLLDNSYPIKLINKIFFSTSSPISNVSILGQINDRKWLDSDAVLSHHITQGGIMQGTDDNENMDDIDQIETSNLEEPREEPIIYTSLPFPKNMPPRLTRLFNNA
ncbi:hypothetical protein WA026_016239 [Henosepilachna vigintioctopunctata]|uniref:Uncharacterized protein n=1 Tax=Henosepilachna vigintioctopunctata TaxID=420089 RepID=A0AAW1TLD6_9CUCU